MNTHLLFRTSLTRTGTNQGNGYPIHSSRTGSSFNFKDGLRKGRAVSRAMNTSKPRRTGKWSPNGKGGHDFVAFK